jgi:TolA-binding protein
MNQMRSVLDGRYFRTISLALCLGAFPALANPSKDNNAKALSAVTAEFQKLEKTLQSRRSEFTSKTRKSRFDPQDSVRLDQRFMTASREARVLEEKWARIDARGGTTPRRAKKPGDLGWERKITRAHDQWLRQTLAAGENPRASTSMHLASLRLMQAVISRTHDDAALNGFRPRLARLYQLCERHADAVRAFLELADPSRTADSAQRIRYLESAIASQTILASWPVNPPWNEVATGKLKGAGPGSQRKELKEIYSRVAQEKGGADNTGNWFYDAHAGLMDWAAGQSSDAIDAWKTRLASQASLGAKSQVHRSQAGGFTLRHHHGKKAWAELEAAARQAMSLGWRPAFGPHKVDPAAMLGDALFEGGKSLLDAGNAAAAAAKLKEFTASFKKDKRFEEALFLRGKAERGASQFEEALATFKEFAARFQKSRFDEEATRIGFELSTDMADEESGLYFGKRYTLSHAKSESAPAIIESYARLALGNGFYSDGTSALEKLAKGVKGPDARAQAMARILDIQTLVASPESILETAGRLLKMGNLTPEIQLRAFRAQARAAASAGQAGSAGIISRAKQDAGRVVSTMGEGDQATRDAWGEILFIDAETRGHVDLSEAFSLGIADPYSYLTRGEADYNRIKAGYDGVCAIGRNLWCAAALFQTARVAEKFEAATRDLRIAETLEADVVERFKAKKAEMMDRWKKDVATGDSQAAELAAQGIAPPQYALAIQLGGGADLVLDDRTIGGLHAFTQIDAR